MNKLLKALKKELSDLRARHNQMEEEDIDEKLDEIINQIHNVQKEDRHHPVS